MKPKTSLYLSLWGWRASPLQPFLSHPLLFLIFEWVKFSHPRFGSKKKKKFTTFEDDHLAFYNFENM